MSSEPCGTVLILFAVSEALAINSPLLYLLARLVVYDQMAENDEISMKNRLKPIHNDTESIAVSSIVRQP